MATMNPFDLLGDDDAEDPSQLIASQQFKTEPKKPSAKPASKPAPPQAKLPSKPLPPTQAVRDAKSESARGGGGGRQGGGYSRGRGRGGGGGTYRDSTSTDISSGGPEETNERRPFERRGGGGGYGGPRGGFRGGRRGGGSSNGEGFEGERPRRTFDRHSGTGRGNEMKREGAGRGNWGTEADEVSQVVEEAADEGEKPVNVEKPAGDEEAAVDAADKEAATKEVEEKEPEDKEMTLEEYEKVLEEKRKALAGLKTEERKVDPKEFESMQPLANKKAGNDDVFIKLGSDKDKKKELAEKEERAKKSVSINQFLKPSDGESYYNRSGGGRGRGRGRGPRGGYSGNVTTVAAPAIEDPSQFPSLGGK